MTAFNWTMGDYKQGATTTTLIRVSGNVGFFAMDTGDLAAVTFADHSIRSACVGERICLRRDNGTIFRATPIGGEYVDHERGIKALAEIHNADTMIVQIMMVDLPTAEDTCAVYTAFTLGHTHEGLVRARRLAEGSWRTLPVGRKDYAQSVHNNVTNILAQRFGAEGYRLVWAYARGLESVAPADKPVVTVTTQGAYAVSLRRGLCRMLGKLGLHPLDIEVDSEGFRGAAVSDNHEGLVRFQSVDARGLAVTDGDSRLLTLHGGDEWLPEPTTWEGSGYGYI